MQFCKTFYPLSVPFLCSCDITKMKHAFLYMYYLVRLSHNNNNLDLLAELRPSTVIKDQDRHWGKVHCVKVFK